MRPRVHDSCSHVVIGFFFVSASIFDLAGSQIVTDLLGRDGATNAPLNVIYSACLLFRKCLALRINK